MALLHQTSNLNVKMCWKQSKFFGGTEIPFGKQAKNGCECRRFAIGSLLNDAGIGTEISRYFFCFSVDAVLCKLAVGAMEPVHHGSWCCRYVLRFHCVWSLLLARIGTGTAKMRFERWDSPNTLYFFGYTEVPLRRKVGSFA